MAKEAVVRKEGGVPAFLQGVEMKGAGVATSQDDLLIPMIRILQALSPEVEKKGTSYIPGAEPGMGLMKNAPNPLINMEKGILFQPVYNNKAVVEWVPRQSGGGGGGGFVTSYPEMPKNAARVAHPHNPKKTMTINPESQGLELSNVAKGPTGEACGCLGCVLSYQDKAQDTRLSELVHF